MTTKRPAVWFPAVRCGTGTDVFTETLVAGLQQRGLRAEITWLPHRAEYAPWTVPVPTQPAWATVCHVNTWLHPHFIPRQLPVVATLHHSIHDPALRPYKGWLRSAYHHWWIRHIERATMRRADSVAAVSRFAADSARAQVLGRLMQVIHNGVDTERFHPPSERQRHHPFRLLYVGSWMARKGVDLLTPIMRELGEGFVLHYTGGAAAEKDKPGMPANMIDLGRLSGDEVVAAMQGADALLFPSRSEGLPLGVLEAMACGLPVIGARATAVTELVADGETGLLCRGESSAEFAQAAQWLANDGQLCSKMREAARQRVEAEFSSLSMIESYIRQYEQLAT
jgi:glycosyltransferase involved in cell wall biosynthesis